LQQVIFAIYIDYLINGVANFALLFQLLTQFLEFCRKREIKRQRKRFEHQFDKQARSLPDNNRLYREGSCC